MGHPLRINVPGLIYHVFSRGNNKDPIFFDTGSYERFLLNLERYREELHYHLYAYCLLPNHFHLLLKTAKVPLSAIMQKLMTAYTMYVNKKYERVGHVFEGRYKSIAVEKETYFLEVVRYIHLNPVRAGLVDNVTEYPWSSYLKYLAAGSDIPIVETTEALAMFSLQFSHQKTLFAEFTTAGLGVNFDPGQEQIRGVLGSAKFIQKITRAHRGFRP